MKAALALAALCACATAQPAPAPAEAPAAASPPNAAKRAQCWMRTEVFFGLSQPGGPITATDFDAFAHDEIESRLPEGFTILQSRGQWQGGHEDSRVLLFVHRCGEKDAEVDAIRAAYKLRFNQQSVPRVDTSTSASF